MAFKIFIQDLIIQSSIFIIERTPNLKIGFLNLESEIVNRVKDNENNFKI